jgi:hypothetical protein
VQWLRAISRRITKTVRGRTSARALYGTKHEAEAAGRDAAQADKVEHVIKNQDGQISSKNSYGNDPRNVPG